MNTLKKKESRQIESAFRSAGLTGVPTIEPSTYTSKHDPDGKPILSKYQAKKLNGSTMALAFLAAAGDANG